MAVRRLRVALFGSPGFALPVLEALHHRHDLRLVVTQPNKPAGRGLQLTSPAAALRARELGIAVAQPARLKGATEFFEQLAGLDLDVGVTAAYGLILPPALLALPRHGILNVHASLLPRHRGAAPVQWALIEGDRETGITIMQTEAGLDTGPIRLQRLTLIEPGEQAPALSARLAVLGAEALSEALELLAAGSLPSEPQDDSRATLAPKLRASDGHIRWGDAASKVVSRHRGVAAWPGSSFEHGGERVKVTAMGEYRRGQGSDQPTGHRVGTGGPSAPLSSNAGTESGSPVPGEVLGLGAGSLLVAAGSGTVELVSVKPPGGREMDAAAWARGRAVARGGRLG